MRRVVVKEQGRSKSGKTRAVSDQNAGSVSYAMTTLPRAVSLPFFKGTAPQLLSRLDKTKQSKRQSRLM